jgi:hypothetical protein
MTELAGLSYYTTRAGRRYSKAIDGPRAPWPPRRAAGRRCRGNDPAGHGGSLARWQGMRRLPIYRRGTESGVRASERSPLWQGMGHSPPDHMSGASAGWPSVLGHPATGCQPRQRRSRSTCPVTRGWWCASVAAPPTPARQIRAAVNGYSGPVRDQEDAHGQRAPARDRRQHQGPPTATPTTSRTCWRTPTPSTTTWSGGC